MRHQIHWSRLCHISELSLEVLSWLIFDVALCLPFEREREKKKLRENVEKFMIFNKCKRLSLSSRVKLPLVRMSASWFLVSTHLIWIFGVQVNSVKQPIKRNAVGSSHVSHRWTSTFDAQFDERFTTFAHVQQRLALRKMCVCGDMVHMWQLTNTSVSLLFGFGCVFSRKNTCLASVSIHSQSSIQRHDFWFRRTVDTDVCFLHIQVTGTNVRFPRIPKTPPEVDFESSRSPAKSESWIKPNRQCWAVLPTWQYCR